MYDIPEADTLWMESRCPGAFGNFDRTTDIADLYGRHELLSRLTDNIRHTKDVGKALMFMF